MRHNAGHSNPYPMNGNQWHISFTYLIKKFLPILIQKGFLKSQPYAVCMAIDGSLGAVQEAAAMYCSIVSNFIA